MSERFDELSRTLAALKKPNPNPRRKNYGDAYHGCLVITVRRSTDLYRQIAGWWAGIVGAAVA